MKYIDLESWPRGEHFRFFSRMDYPHFNICAEVDITGFFGFLKENGLPFFSAALYLSSRAVNEVREFRCRIRDGKVVEHEKVDPAITVLGKEGVFGYCTIGYHPEARTFMAEAAAVIAEAKENPTIAEDPARDDVIYYTSIPWVSFTSLSHPINLHPVDSIPRIAWGKYFNAGGRRLLPYSVQVHHALADGLHVGRHFELFQKLLDRPEILIA
ncbi:MAG: chloramphenicol acetyltransferase [PVC group bacterium]